MAGRSGSPSRFYTCRAQCTPQLARVPTRSFATVRNHSAGKYRMFLRAAFLNRLARDEVLAWAGRMAAGALPAEQQEKVPRNHTKANPTQRRVHCCALHYRRAVPLRQTLSVRTHLSRLVGQSAHSALVTLYPSVFCQLCVVHRLLLLALRSTQRHGTVVLCTSSRDQ